jgi:hypothetical protein
LEIHRGTGYVPMRVVARMSEPIAYLGDLLHLDGFLSYAAYHDLPLETRKTIAPVESTPWPIDFGLPLSTWSTPAPAGCDDRLLKSRNGLRRGFRGLPGTDCRAGDERRLWGFCASAADDAAWLGRTVLEVRKKPALGAMGRYTRDKSANLSSGHMKAYDLKIPMVVAMEVEWFAHGDPDHVRHLLTEHVPSIGKKRNTGNGIVREWIVESCADDRSTVVEGHARRRLATARSVRPTTTTPARCRASSREPDRESSPHPRRPRSLADLRGARSRVPATVRRAARRADRRRGADDR